MYQGFSVGDLWLWEHSFVGEGVILFINLMPASFSGLKLMLSI